MGVSTKATSHDTSSCSNVKKGRSSKKEKKRFLRVCVVGGGGGI